MDVSIIMMCYNQEKTIERALMSVLSQQTRYKYEIIIGDDCSTDSTRQICERIANSYPEKVKLNDKHPNYGVLKNYSYCLSRCSGDFLMGCSGDDWWHNPQKIELQVSYMKSAPQCVLHYGGFREYYPETEMFIEKHPLRTSMPLFDSVILCNPVCALTACVRMSAVKQIDYDSFMKQGFLVEDYPKWIALSTLGDFQYSEESLATYSVYKGSVWRSSNYNHKIKYIENNHLIRKYFVNKEKPDNQRLLDKVDDLYHKEKGEVAVQYGLRKDAWLSFKKIKNRNYKIILKQILCSNLLFFHFFRRHYNKLLEFNNQ